MVVFYSIRQLLRTPVKTIFFFVLLACTITFFILGCNLWSITAQSIDQVNRSFTTIGTVEQKPMSLETEATWDAYTKRYTYRNFSTYGSQIPISVLDFKGANYIQKPEKRPYYYAYDPSYKINSNSLAGAAFDADLFIVEIQPEADCIPNQPVQVKVKKVLMGNPGNYMDEIWFCDSENDKTEPMKKDKTYIVGLTQDPYYYMDVGSDKIVYMPVADIESSQFKKDGERIPDMETMTVAWDEVVDNFFDTPIGRRWQVLIDSYPKMKHYIPVVPTNSTNLLMEFYTGDARITQGRDISSAEYQSGEKVCLVQKEFAQNNGLKVGDSLHLPLLYADYYSSSSRSFQPDFLGAPVTSPINAKGEAYSVFEDSSYKIIGIYDTQPTGLSLRNQLGYNTVVIPSASIKNSDENNIVDSGPMREYSTSFQIPNGQIDQFMSAWQAQGITGLDIKFYDKGYTKIKAGLDSMMNIAVILFAVGAATSFFVLVLFCHLFITKQRKRTAIERSLGMSRRLCALSMLVGMMIIVVAAFAAGSVASYQLTGYTVTQVNAASSQSSFNSLFSDRVNSADAKATAAFLVSTQGANGWGTLAGALFIPVALLIAFANIRGNLKLEPLALLSEKEK